MGRDPRCVFRRVCTALLVAAAVAAGGGAWASAADADGLAITVSGSPSRLIVGDTASLTATVTNTSTVAADDVNVVFAAGFGTSFTLPTVVAPPGCLDFVSVSCAVGTLAPGASQAVVVVVAGLRTDGTVQVNAAANADNVPGSATVTWEGMLEPKADLKFDLSVTPESIMIGSTTTVRAVVTNTSQDGMGYGAVVKFSLPPEVQIASRPAGCTGTALSLQCPVGDIPAQRTGQAVLELRAPQQGAFTVLGSVLWDRPDTTPVDTQGQVNVSVVPPPEPDTTGGAPAAPTGPPKPVAAAAASLARGLPESGGCFRRRRITLILRPRGVWDPVAATIRVTGRKRALVLKNSRAQAPFTLSLPRTGRVVLKLAVTYDSGRSYTAKRTFRRCRAR